ncbi:APC family permease [Streptomyces sp. NBC_00083]|uniref:APC family permease n=1 Tax=Streptomyces sp. NBC_00083 TaxID=2975647 RepID=UPI00224E5AB5|nr:APC family permease [Streptomyces sp. NBC_00083]MCX5388261.1 APC family permease [Streptomyces sp. NBC_00083]
MSSSTSGRGLQPNVLSPFDTVVMAVAGSAPAYSLAATTSVLVGSVGLASPAALLYCAIPMLGIVLAFGRLGRIDVNAGAAYSWVGRTLHPFLGFLSGWALVVAATLFMVAGSLPAGQMTLGLFDAGLAHDTALATATGAGWFLLMLGVVLGGARLSARAQLVISGIELTILFGFSAGALIRVGEGAGAVPFDWSWLGFSHFDGVSGFAAGTLIAAFYYWGWDVTSNLSEETRDSRRTAGLAALVGVGVVFALFLAFTVATDALLTGDEITHGQSNVLALLGERIWPGAGGQLMVLAAVLSTIATLETTLIQVTRSLFAMGRDRTMPGALGALHRRWNTPWVAIVVVGAVALVLFVASNALGSVQDIMADALSAIGLQTTLYYGLAGLAAVVAYRRTLTRSVGSFLLGGVWPLLGSVFMFCVFGLSLTRLSGAAVAIGIGSLLAGIVPMLWYWRRGSPYYRPARLDATRSFAAGAGHANAPTRPAGHANAGHPTDF